MKVAVWDTYVAKPNGTVMHFDIVVPESITDSALIFEYGKKYLADKGIVDAELSAKQCQFCHIEEVKTAWKETILREGFFIFEMENCT